MAPSLTGDAARPWGCYWFEGAQALWMGTDKMNAAEESTLERQIICANTTGVDFARIAAGTCADIHMFTIHSQSTCEDAASDLGLIAGDAASDEVAASYTDSTERPEGCYWYTPSAALWLARRPSNVGSPATYYRQSLCSSMPEQDAGPSLAETFYFGKELPSSETGVALDAGAGFGATTADGLAYGWSCERASSDMNFARSKSLESFLGMGMAKIDKRGVCLSGTEDKKDADSWPPVTWELEVPNGSYQVEVLFPNDKNSGCMVEGVLACEDQPDESDYCRYQGTVAVSDGRLTITGYSIKSGLCTRIAKVSIASAQ